MSLDSIVNRVWGRAREDLPADAGPAESCKLTGTRIALTDSRVSHVRRGGRVVDGSGLENRRTRKGTGGSNPSLSAMPFVINQLKTVIPAGIPELNPR